MKRILINSLAVIICALFPAGIWAQQVVTVDSTGVVKNNEIVEEVEEVVKKDTVKPVGNSTIAY